jgi:anti-sigma factor RsiW
VTSGHLDVELIPYLRDELAADELARASHHLEECAACRSQLDGVREILAALRAQPPEVAEIDWRRYRAELRHKLEERSRRRWSWSMPRLVPVAATAPIAGLALMLTVRGGIFGSADDDLPVFEQTAIGTHLDLLRNYSVVENLDLFEDFEVVQDLDDLSPVERG